ncbi:hypothetical protein MMA231_03991 (plasmid) [Asticcacaulis sp. MM231]|uniref:hypothetical protein n=1 Tax=Asticcacaulis sp. MM231 TaxID=3157666 RepID=UPI0032D57D5B
MSEWHFHEYARRLTSITRDIWTGLHSNESMVREQFTLIQKAKAVLENPTVAGVKALAATHALLEADHREYNEQGKFQTEEIASIVANRVLLKALDKDRFRENVDQLNRLMETNISNHIRLLGKKYDIPRSVLKKDKEFWFAELKKEEKRKNYTKPRSEEALEADACTLAHVLHAAYESDNMGETVLFITADDLVFDTYRRWYTSSAIFKKNLPFALRRIVQYTPMINMADSDNALGGDVRMIFQEIRQTVNTIVSPLVFTRSRYFSENLAKGRMETRLSMPLRLGESKKLSQEPDLKLLADQIREEGGPHSLPALNEVMDGLRFIERLTLGLADDYVRARLYRLEQELPEINHDPASYEQAVKKYIQKKIDGAIAGSERYSVPLAKQFIRDWKSPDPGHIRVPIAFFRQSQLGGILDDVMEAGKERLTPSHWEILGEQPSTVFYFAAWLALVSSKWGEADEYADLCLMWMKALPGGATRVGSDEQAEAFFLCALSKRFYIGSISPSPRTETQSLAAAHFRRAEEILNGCIRYHQGRLKDGCHQLRLLRGKSELAALNLFYAATLITSIRQDFVALPTPPEERRLHLEAAAHIRTAVALLSDCLDNLPTEREVKAFVAQRRNFYNQLEIQIGINFAAACGLDELLPIPLGIRNYPASERARPILERLRVYFCEREVVPTPDLLKLEIELYFCIEGVHGKGMHFVPPDKSFLRLDTGIFKALHQVYQSYRSTLSKIPRPDDDDGAEPLSERSGDYSI